MATPESALKKFMKDQAKKFADLHGLHHRWDQPQPGRFGTRGRPDCYFDIGPCHFRIEVKAAANAEPSGLQDAWLEDDSRSVRYMPVLVCGRGGAEEFFASLPSLIILYCASQQGRLEQMSNQMLLLDTHAAAIAGADKYLEYRG